MSARRAAQASGFTLLEMLVALAVLSIAALALVRLDAFTIRSTAQLDSDMVAGIVAANAAADVLTDPAPPTIGTSSEAVSNGGRAWTVAREVAPTGDDSVLRIDILVSGADGGRARLTTVRVVG